MSTNLVNKTTGELVTLANGTRMWIGTKSAHDLAVLQGTMPNNCMVCITDDAAGEEAWQYSTSETRTGKTWIDGKPIYRKVFTGFNVSTTSNTWANLLPNNENIEVITDCSCWNKDNRDYDVNSTTQFIFRIYNGYIQYMLVVGFSGGFKSVCLEYTKTTD